mgnify:CR=1 FL=1
MDSKVSVIVPVNNDQENISSCIESVLKQNYSNIELLLVDGGSTDHSGNICDEYAIKDNRIKVIHSSNKGPGANRNIGINESTGDFIFFLDSDDYMEDTALYDLIEQSKQRDVDISIGDFLKVEDIKISSGHDTYFQNTCVLDKREINNYIRCYLKKPNKFPLFVYSWGRLFKSSIIKDNEIRFKEELRTFEDVDFNFVYLQHTNKVCFMNKVVINHTIHSDYLSETMRIPDNPKKIFGFKEALDSVYAYLSISTDIKTTQKEIGHAFISYSIIQLIRICGQVQKGNKETVLNLIYENVNDQTLRNSLRHYSPGKGESRMIPFLMKLKLIRLILFVCTLKGKKRYG